MPLRVSALLSLVLLTGCGGVDEFDQCVEHSVEEGFDRETVEEACRASLSED